MPSYRMQNIDNLNYDLLTHLMASFINPDTLGNMSWTGDITKFVSSVHNHNAKAIISIGGGGDYSWGPDVAIYEKLLQTSTSRTAFIHKIMNYIRLHNIDGLDNDMEGSALALSNFNVFTQELSDSVHAAGLEMSAAIGVESNWGANLWDQTSLDKLDFVMTMSYGGVGSWNWNTEKNDQGFEKMKYDMEHFTITKNLPAQKVIGGIPFYSVEYPKTALQSYSGLSKTICNIFQDAQYAGQNPIHTDTLYTSTGNVVYINSVETIKKKMDYCNSHGGGIMIWEVGQDCFDGSISLLDTMANYAQAQALSTQPVSNVEKINIYPNPTTDQIHFSNQDLKEVIIYSVSGQILRSQPHSKSIQLNEFAKGTYIIKTVSSFGEIRFTTIIKK